MAFNGVCLIRGAGINSVDGRVHLDLKAVDGSFDWNWFLAKQEHNREILAIALAAITANKNVLIQTEATTPWAELWWFDLNS
jgi:hypothetical protein